MSSSRSSDSGSTTAARSSSRPSSWSTARPCRPRRRSSTARSVKARVVGATRGPKIDGFVYKPKSNNRRRCGHRQDLSVIEILDITPASAKQ